MLLSDNNQRQLFLSKLRNVLRMYRLKKLIICFKIEISKELQQGGGLNNIRKCLPIRYLNFIIGQITLILKITKWNGLF